MTRAFPCYVLHRPPAAVSALPFRAGSAFRSSVSALMSPPAPASTGNPAVADQLDRLMSWRGCAVEEVQGWMIAQAYQRLRVHGAFPDCPVRQLTSLASFDRLASAIGNL